MSWYGALRSMHHTSFGDINMERMRFTAVIHKEGKWYVADCPEVGTVSQGKTIEEAITNLQEATTLYLEEFPA